MTQIKAALSSQSRKQQVFKIDLALAFRSRLYSPTPWFWPWVARARELTEPRLQLISRGVSRTRSRIPIWCITSTCQQAGRSSQLQQRWELPRSQPRPSKVWTTIWRSITPKSWMDARRSRVSTQITYRTTVCSSLRSLATRVLHPTRLFWTMSQFWTRSPKWSD